MRRRSRLLRVAKWGGVVVCITLISAGVANLWCGLTMELPDGSGLATGSGMLVVWWRTWFASGEVIFTFWDANEWLFWPVLAIDDGPTVRSPIWFLLLVIGIPTLVAWRFDRRLSVPGCCPCGYDLTGNVSGVCPECGVEANL